MTLMRWLVKQGHPGMTNHSISAVNVTCSDASVPQRWCGYDVLCSIISSAAAGSTSKRHRPVSEENPGQAESQNASKRNLGTHQLLSYFLLAQARLSICIFCISVYDSIELDTEQRPATIVMRRTNSGRYKASPACRLLDRRIEARTRRSSSCWRRSRRRRRLYQRLNNRSPSSHRSCIT